MIAHREHPALALVHPRRQRGELGRAHRGAVRLDRRVVGVTAVPGVEAEAPHLVEAVEQRLPSLLLVESEALVVDVARQRGSVTRRGLHREVDVVKPRVVVRRVLADDLDDLTDAETTVRTELDRPIDDDEDPDGRPTGQPKL